MEFKEFISKFDKMCSLSSCTNCAFFDLDYENCTQWVFENPDKAEEFLIKWHSTHKTNREKFMEVFGHTFNDPNAICDEMFYIYSPITKNTLDYAAKDKLWWDKLYREPEENKIN